MLPYSAFAQLKTLPRDNHCRVYGLFGDAYLQSRAIERLIEWNLPADARDFNFDSVAGETTRLADLFGLCRNLPFLADQRVVLVKHAERLEGLQRGDETAEKGKTSPARRFADGIEALSETTVLILSRTPETPEPGGRPATPRCISAPADRAIEGRGKVINCTIGPKDAGIAAGLLQEEARRRDIPLDRSAAAHLVSRQGHDFENLLQELDKCALRAGLGKPVTTAIIDEMTQRTSQETVFDLTDALGARRGGRAIGLLRELLDAGEPPELILTLLVRHLRQLMQARAFIDAGLPLDAGIKARLPASLAAQLPQDSKDDLTAVLAARGWLGPRLAQQARNYSNAEIQRALERALMTDLALKGIEGDGGTPELLLELMIADLC